MGNAHIWFYKTSPLESGAEIMLQKRGHTKNRSGWFHISTGGHINIGETAIQAALREAKEELGISLSADKLYFLQTARNFDRAPHDIASVYLYRLTGAETFTYQDGEVAGFKWINLNDFKNMVKEPENYKLVPMGNAYFNIVISGLEHVLKLKQL